MPREHIHFVTGRLAEKSLRSVVEGLAAEVRFGYSIDVLPITVAALMSPAWIAKRLTLPPETAIDRVLIPGYCDGDLSPIGQVAGAPVERGPRDLRQLPVYFHQRPRNESYGKYDIEILAEINHCPRITVDEIITTARRLAADGADIIDIGCDPVGTWPAVAAAVGALCDEGFRVSIDSMNVTEIDRAVRAGAELVLSVNSTNCRAAADWGCEVVAVPDVPETLTGLDETIDGLTAAGVSFRIDPILEPISFGFAASLGRFLDVRRRYPSAEMLMGVGNLTELTDVDSAGVNVLLLGVCQELGIHSVLTTQVINWARTSVRECDLARRLMHYAIHKRVLPKHIEPRLVVLRDAELVEPTNHELDQLAADIKDYSYRIFAADGELHIVGKNLHLQGADPFALFDALMHSGRNGAAPRNINPAHAYYLGHEMCNAATALALGKQYQQDEPLDWGFISPATRADKR